MVAAMVAEAGVTTAMLAVAQMAMAGAALVAAMNSHRAAMGTIRPLVVTNMATVALAVVALRRRQEDIVLLVQLMPSLEAVPRPLAPGRAMVEVWAIMTMASRLPTATALRLAGASCQDQRTIRTAPSGTAPTMAVVALAVVSLLGAMALATAAVLVWAVA